MSSVKQFRKFALAIVTMEIPEALLPPSLRAEAEGMMMQVSLGRPATWAVDKDWRYRKFEYVNPGQTFEYEVHLWIDSGRTDEQIFEILREKVLDSITIPDYIGDGLEYPSMTPDDYIADGDAWDPETMGEPNINPDDPGEVVNVNPNTRLYGTLDPEGRFAISNESVVFARPDLSDRDVPLGRCCHCNENEADHIILLPYRAPVDGTGWGCHNCDAPCDGAISVVCTECLEPYEVSTLKDMALTVCVGFPADNVRVVKSAVIDRPYWHIDSNWGPVED